MSLLSRDISSPDIERATSNTDPPLPPERPPNDQQPSPAVFSADNTTKTAAGDPLTLRASPFVDPERPSTPERLAPAPRAPSSITPITNSVTTNDFTFHTNNKPTWANILSKNTKNGKSQNTRKIVANAIEDEAHLMGLSWEHWDISFADPTIPVSFPNEEFPAYEDSEDDPHLQWSYHVLEYDRRDNAYCQQRIQQVDALLRKRVSIKDKLSLLNNLPPNPRSVRMNIRTRGQLSAPQMEFLLKQKALKEINRLLPTSQLLTNKCDEYEVVARANNATKDLLMTYMHTLQEKQIIELEIVVWAYIGNIKVILDQAYFIQLLNTSHLMKIAIQYGILDYKLAKTTKQVKQRIIEVLELERFVTPDGSAEFTISH